MFTAVITLGILAVALTAALVLVVRYFLADISEREDAISLERIGWVEERRELLNRIQRPEYVPTMPVMDFRVPELEPDEFDLVGTMQDTVGEQ